MIGLTSFHERNFRNSTSIEVYQEHKYKNGISEFNDCILFLSIEISVILDSCNGALENC